MAESGSGDEYDSDAAETTEDYNMDSDSNTPTPTVAMLVEVVDVESPPQALQITSFPGPQTPPGLLFPAPVTPPELLLSTPEDPLPENFQTWTPATPPELLMPDQRVGEDRGENDREDGHGTNTSEPELEPEPEPEPQVWALPLLTCAAIKSRFATSFNLLAYFGILHIFG